MPVSREDALTAVLQAILGRLEQAVPDAAGNVDEATQADVDDIAALADEEHLPGLLAELNSSQDGPSFAASIYALAGAGASAEELAAAARELASRTPPPGRKPAP